MRRVVVALVLFAGLLVLPAWIPVPVASDPNIQMPGSARGSAVLDPPVWCDNCHGGYNKAIEPAHNWRGSMMAQAGRDPLWFAAMTAAQQDSLWLLGNPNGADLCLRCHVPTGWLGGRTDPVNGTKLAAADMVGVSCDMCHRMVDPMHALRQPDVATVPAATAQAQTTFDADLPVLLGLKLADGSNYFDAATGLPRFYLSGYREATSGQFVVDPATAKRGNRFDSRAMHPVYYSRFHKSREFCGSCHDVSNAPVANRLIGAGTSDQRSAATFVHLERTFSEFKASAYGRGGAATAPGSATRFASRCQDCHMPAREGVSAAIPGLIKRTDLALHDLTGGNAWISGMLATVDAKGTVYDPYNDAILSGRKYPGARIDVAGLQGLSQALLDGRNRALEQLRMAASLGAIRDGDSLRVTLRNDTGHKLISGFPEGRRMWLNVRYFDARGDLVGEINPYAPLVITRDANGNAVYVSGGDLQVTDDRIVYEAKMSSSLTTERETFHFLLVTDRTKDNRIPPKGFDVNDAAARLSLPRLDGTDRPDIFSAEEYAGGYDDVVLPIPVGAVSWRVALYYQTTTKAYIDFLRDEIEGTATSLRRPAPSGIANAYVAQTDPFFATQKDWGKAIWDLWLHNGGSAPVLMESVEPRRRMVRR